MLLVEILLPGACELHLGFVLKLVLWGDCVPQHAGRVRIRVRVRVRVRGGGITSCDFTLQFLKQDWPDSHIQSLSTIRLGGYLTRSVFPPNPPMSSPCTVRL